MKTKKMSISSSISNNLPKTKQYPITSNLLNKLKENLKIKKKPEEIISNIKNNEVRVDKRLNSRNQVGLKRTSISLSPLKNSVLAEGNLLPPNGNYTDFKTLVLDLDETLVHSTFDEIERYDLIIPIVIENIIYDVYVLLRPGIYEFIEELSHIYEIVIFTASMPEYADPLISKIDKNNRCLYRLFREHCTYIDGTYVKDLSKMGRNLRNIVIVDNSPLSYSLQQSNGIPIKSWFDDREDRELFKLLPVLKNLSGFYDIRSETPKFITANTLIWSKAIKWIEENYIITTSKLDDTNNYNLLSPYTNSSNSSHFLITEDYYTATSNMTETIIYDSCESDQPETFGSKNSHKTNQNPFYYNNKTTSDSNININIINGNYNNIVLTDGNFSSAHSRAGYDRIIKENPNNFLNIKNKKKKYSNKSLPGYQQESKFNKINTKKVELHYNLYNKKKNNTNYAVLSEGNKYIENCKKEIIRNDFNDHNISPKAEKLTLNNKLENNNADPYLNEKKDVCDIYNSESTPTNHNKKSSDNLINKPKRNSVSIHKMKSKFSSFMKNEFLKDKNEDTLISNTNFTNNSIKINNTTTSSKIIDNNNNNINIVKKNILTNSKIFKKTRNANGVFKSNKSDIDSYLLETGTIFRKLDSVLTGKSNFVKLSKNESHLKPNKERVKERPKQIIKENQTSNHKERKKTVTSKIEELRNLYSNLNKELLDNLGPIKKISSVNFDKSTYQYQNYMSDCNTSNTLKISPKHRYQISKYILSNPSTREIDTFDRNKKINIHTIYNTNPNSVVDLDNLNLTRDLNKNSGNITAKAGNKYDYNSFNFEKRIVNLKYPSKIFSSGKKNIY